MPAPSGSHEQLATLDAIQLMLRDLHTRHDDIRHRAAFRGCTSELLDVQQELVDYLLAKKGELMGQNCRDGQSLPSYSAYL